ncbi:MAG: hypothetical protein LH477_18905 [Nocardioides sp.]|nr:hypothetical protein [Nocardioides sp.]
MKALHDSVPDPTRFTDDALERWVAAAEEVCSRLGPGGRAAIAVLGESLVDATASPWFGYEPSARDLAALLGALDEDPAAGDELVAIEAGMVARRLGNLSDPSRTRWLEVAEAAVQDPCAQAALPERVESHREAERVWREAAAAVQDWRAVALDPDLALRQVRWYPGTPTRTFIGYADPLNLRMVQRAVEEHRFSREEWDALQPVAEMLENLVDPLSWRLSSLAFAVARAVG